MSVAFAAPRQRGKGDITPAAIQKMLDENNHLIQCIMDYQNKGKTSECSQYQQMLHTNLVYLATIADSNQNTQPLLSALPTQNMPMGPAGMNQSGPPQPPRPHNMPSEGMVGGGPSAPHIQNQMNGQMPGPNHIAMQGPAPGQHNMPNSSMNMPSNNHGSMGGYNHSVPSSQNIPAQNQMTMNQGQSMGNYGPRPNITMQPNQAAMMHQQPPSQQYTIPQGGQHYQGQQPPIGMMSQVNQGNHMMGQRQIPPYRPSQQGPPQQFSGQEEYYGEQYSHGAQGPPESMNQQYYPEVKIWNGNSKKKKVLFFLICFRKCAIQSTARNLSSTTAAARLPTSATAICWAASLSWSAARLPPFTKCSWTSVPQLPARTKPAVCAIQAYTTRPSPAPTAEAICL
ncbi:synovial sarcoma translocation, chromosome 18 L homeolog isoform X2 [Xenopus laevis]|uniref:Synovial sarcoma translocation, chromosome 18 L homeolog isoform X2 n=1 Tax=Xenopus laevis TaxID=8355 RepID=A0A8J1KV79_XENLA|nr:synovial sarcoma translocation, chromosome 18 L homeolog isoform X2 [Xenopus laevis]XP_041421220.1 synovial sarcoma translocation, chromosome 18 L homeolog isoform X2 [Xenopus laevis]